MKRLHEELDDVKRQHKTHVENLEKASKDKFKELQIKNASLQDELQNEKTMNAANTQRIALVIRQCEDATASAASSAFFRFSKQEFQDLAIQVNQEHHDLIAEMFRNMDEIFETYVAFDKISIVLEYQVAKSEKDSKACDDIQDWKRYMKGRP